MSEIDAALALPPFYTASAAIESGVDVIAHVDGLPPLDVRKIEAVQGHAEFVRIRCWSSEKAMLEVWEIPIARCAVQICDDWHA
jgi:hypothetical protein